MNYTNDLLDYCNLFFDKKSYILTKFLSFAAKLFPLLFDQPSRPLTFLSSNFTFVRKFSIAGFIFFFFIAFLKSALIFWTIRFVFPVSVWLEIGRILGQFIKAAMLM